MFRFPISELDLEGRELDVEDLKEEFPNVTFDNEYISADDEQSIAELLKEFFEDVEDDLEGVEEFEPQGDKDQEVSDEVGEASTAFDGGSDTSTDDIDVVDTTDGVDDDESESLKAALEAMDPVKRNELLKHFAMIKEDVTPVPTSTIPVMKEDIRPDSGNALAKLIGSLKF